MKYIGYGEGELRGLDMYDTEEAAFQATADRLEESGQHETIIVDAVREPMLSDFVNVSILTGLIRERMAELIGNDDALSRPSTVVMMERHIASVLPDVIDAAARFARVRLDGYITVDRTLHERWWEEEE